ncbi:hypothetical protein [Gilliamella sp. wkB112]|uniref:hypothetical protein n=1 Tax=Gilliamella sp. wkB112 TaxID=3120257 RepID=UPI00080EC556|nr:hypothetical protein [Gilliamella apicola]OCG01370.1 hypothetical protein A9G12_02140 [Gilliamella apicola]
MTKATDTNSLLGITISDGTTQTTYTPENNTSTTDNPIVLPVENQSFADIGMSVPPTTNSITLNELIGAPNNYWGDDDGDGQGVNGVTATGSLSVTITDKNGQSVSRDTVLSLCDKAPYKVELTSTSGSLTTQYGLPSSTNFSGGTAIYYISPKEAPKICYAAPNLAMGENTGFIPGWYFAGPTTIWNPDKGFLTQSNTPSSYGLNFPTTGINRAHFDLQIDGIDASKLTWPAVTRDGITATMTPTDNKSNTIRVTLTGPAVTAEQTNLDSPGALRAPILPQTFELVGYNSSNVAIVKYGFVLKKWFVMRTGLLRGDSAKYYDTYPKMLSWCTGLGSGYRLTQVKDLTNSVCSGAGSTNSLCQGAIGATPSSSGNHYQRNIDAGLLAEWGNLSPIVVTNYGSWASDGSGPDRFIVDGLHGNVHSRSPDLDSAGYCVYP